MKKTQLVACFILLLFACNNPSEKHADHNNMHPHSDSSATSTKQVEGDSSNAITTSMSSMMQNMHSIIPTGNNDLDFAAMMLEHHKGAVEMSKIKIERGTNAELQQFAQTVIADQNKEIAFMGQFIATSSKTTSANSATFQKALNNSMMAMMSNSAVIYNNIDKDFAAQMIPHHQSAVDMAKVYLARGKEVTLVALCRNIVTAQTKEINWLKDWLAKNKG